MAVQPSRRGATGAKGRRSLKPTKLREQLTGYLFIFPATFLIAIFGLFPILYAIYMSTHRWRVRQGPYVALQNFESILGSWWGALLFAGGFVLLLTAYWLWSEVLRAPYAAPFSRKLLVKLPAVLLVAGALFGIAVGWEQMAEAGDARFLRSLQITLYYALGTIPTQIVIALVIANMLFQNLKGQEFFRMIFFLPYIVPVVAVAAVFERLFSPRDTAFMNTVLSTFGLPPQRWLQEPRALLEVVFGLNLDGFWAGPSLALVTIVIFGIWNYVGFNIIVFLAGLGGIPRDLYEAAEIDGAGRWQSFIGITVPLLSPITFYLTLIGFIGTFQVFNSVYVMRSPQALGTVDTTSIVIFDTFFARNQYGLATAQAMLLFLIILFITVAQGRFFGRRVFYG